MTNKFKFTGRVVFEDIGPGFWGIKSRDGRNYRPIEMPQVLQKEGLTLEGEAELAEGEVSLFMWGEAIYLRKFKIIAS